MSTPGASRPSGFELTVSRLNEALGVVGALILIAMLLLVSISVVMRYVFNSPITWSDQVATYGLVYVTFIGAPRVLARRGHVAVDILETSLSEPRRRLLHVLVDITGMLYCLAFCTLAGLEVQRIVARGATFSDAFTMPQWMVYIVIPLGAGLLALQFLANMLGDLRKLHEPLGAMTPEPGAR